MEKKKYIIVTEHNHWIGGGEMTEKELQEEINIMKEWYPEAGSAFFAYVIIGEPLEFT